MKSHTTLFLALLLATHTWGQARLRRMTTAQGLPNNQVRQIVELPNHQILVATEGMFSIYNGREFVPLTCNLDSVRRLPAFGGHSHYWQGDSLLWLKDFYHLYLFDTQRHKFRYDYDRRAPSPQVEQFLREPADTIARKTRERLKPHAEQLYELVHASHLQNEPLQAYLRDRQGGEWYGLRDGGIIYKRPLAPRARLVEPGINDVARRIADLDGRLMLIAGERGIYEYDSRTQKVVGTIAPPSSASIKAGSEIYTYEMTADSRGRVWIATDKGLGCYERGKVEWYNQSNSTGLIHNHVRFALPLDANRLLVCNFMHQLGYFYPEQRRLVSLNDRLPALNDYRTMVAACLLTNRNHAAVCTQNGLFVLDVAEDKMYEPSFLSKAGRHSRKFNCILRDRVGRLWVGTQNGLLLTDGDSTLRRITQSEGLSNNCIQSLAEDASGCVWVGTASGVNRIRIGRTLDDTGIRHLSEEEGIPDVGMTERGICIMPDSTLYLASPAGMVTLPTAAFYERLEPDSMVLVGLTIAGEDMPLDTLPIRLNYRQNYIELQASALDYAHSPLTRYRYRLEALEDNWHTVTDGSGMVSIRYNALLPGTYTLEVQASKSDAQWGPPLRKTFIINPPVWRTWWAELFYIILAGGIVLFLLHLYLKDRKRKMKREQEAYVNHLFELREEAQRQFALSAGGLHSPLGNAEENLVAQLTKAIGKNIDNVNYTTDQLARDMGMSRASLYKRMQQTLGVTPADFIRNVRLKRATRLLSETLIPINQISLMVGFQTPRHFSQTFRETFGITPTAYRSGGNRTSSPGGQEPMEPKQPHT